MKLKIFKGILVLTLLTLLVACTPTAAPQPQAMVGCEASISDISVLSGGSDFVAVNLIFTISNPNPYQVMVDSLTYQMDTGQGAGVYSEVPYPYYVPAGEEVTIIGFGILKFTDIVGKKMMVDGLPAAKAAGAAVPLWKGLSGKKPGMIPQEAWDALPAESVTYSYETTIYTIAQGKQDWVRVAGEWSPPEAGK